MIEIVAIAFGGALGALLRWGMTEGVTRMTGTSFPYGTLLVNVVGSLLIGIVFVYLLERAQAGVLSSPALKSAVMVGLLGAFTTFSTFSLQTLQMMMEGRWVAGTLYVLGSVLLCLVATAAGIGVARLLP